MKGEKGNIGWEYGVRVFKGNVRLLSSPVRNFLYVYLSNFRCFVSVTKDFTDARTVGDSWSNGPVGTKIQSRVPESEARSGMFGSGVRTGYFDTRTRGSTRKSEVNGQTTDH